MAAEYFNASSVQHLGNLTMPRLLRNLRDRHPHRLAFGPFQEPDSQEAQRLSLGAWAPAAIGSKELFLARLASRMLSASRSSEARG